MSDTNIYLKRNIFTDITTIGDLFWGPDFFCNTLEDTCRKRAGDDNVLTAAEKVPGKTAIPAGRYEIKMEWSNHYQRMMPHLQNVPLFTYIMMHWGNKAEDTDGCVLVGVHAADMVDWIGASQATYNRLEPKITEALAVGRLFISISGGYTA